MARKPKKGLEFYSVDTDIFQNRKIKRLIRNYGAKGYLVYNYILTEIYREKGYFIEWDANTIFDVSDAINLKETLVNEVVNYCCNLSLFNKELFDSENVLTTKNIQDFYLDVCRKAKRRNVKILEKYDVSVYLLQKKMETIPLKRELIPLKRELIPSKREESTQSKVKKSKYIPISLYRDIDFLKDWKELREEHLKLPTNILKLSSRELTLFSGVCIDYKKECVRNALKALFKQEVIKFSSMQLRPKHFLENFEIYLSAYEQRDTKLWGSKPKENTL